MGMPSSPAVCSLLAGTSTQQQPGTLFIQRRQQLLVGLRHLELLNLQQALEPQSMQLGSKASLLLLLVGTKQKIPCYVLLHACV
jgi:hypothetical protein